MLLEAVQCTSGVHWTASNREKEFVVGSRSGLEGRFCFASPQDQSEKVLDKEGSVLD